VRFPPGPPGSSLALLLLFCSASWASQTPARSLELPDEGYLGSAACLECHAANHASWHASFHRTMTQAPSAAAVLAPFDGQTPALEGQRWMLAREGEAFLATPLDTAGQPSGPPARVALTTGSHHYQIYWMISPAAEGLMQFPLVWHVAERRWLPRKAMFLQPPGPTGSETDRWQAVCIKCHATNGTPSHGESGATRVAELGIACEACHGPGGRHAEFRRSSEAAGVLAHETDPVVPSALAAERSAQICGQCHGIHVFGERAAEASWEREGFAYRPGDDLALSRSLLRGRVESNTEALRAFLARNPGTLAEYFWPDGEVRVSGREYNGLVESPCFQRGAGERRMSCLSCHEMHPDKGRVDAGWSSDQLRVDMDGPKACLQCHPKYGEPDALAAHTHHPRGSTGSDCLSCHMPRTTYGLTKAIRSHTITSPDAAVSLAAGRPNACNLCHLDRSLGWTAERLAEWYGHERPALDADTREVAASVLWALTGDAGLRALAATALAWEPARAVSGTGWMPYLVSTLALDEYDAVRWLAQGTARLEPRWAGFTLDLGAPLEEQRDQVRETLLSDWLARGLEAGAAQRAAVLVREGGKLDEARFRALYGRRDGRPVRLAE
jgi:cytochrome c554/c'-like protein